MLVNQEPSDTGVSVVLPLLYALEGKEISVGAFCEFFAGLYLKLDLFLPSKPVRALFPLGDIVEEMNPYDYSMDEEAELRQVAMDM